MTEIPLGGGNVSGGVVRIGDTVRRPAGPWTPAVHALLGHLHAAGFGGAPRPLGLDELGREVLTFIPGTIAWPDTLALLDPDDRLRRVARLIGDFHDAVTGFCPPPDARWQALGPRRGDRHHRPPRPRPLEPGHQPAPLGVHRLGHRRPRVPVVGCRIRPAWLRAAQRQPRYQRGNPAHRMRLFADSYGLDQAQRQELFPMLARRTKAMHDFLAGRARSFKEFMTEWVTEQFMKNLAEFDLEKPWFWDLFMEELDYAHHSFQLGLYTYRTTLWFDIAMPDPTEREWLNAKYPRWEETYGALWDQLERRWETGEANTLSYGLPALCNLCQLPALFIRPGRNTACTLETGGRRYQFCSEPCRWIFQQESSRFADHHSVIDRIVAGQAPGNLIDPLEWMGLRAPVETGKDLRRGIDPWRLAPIPTA
jgi:hypothetical protein